MVRIRQTNQDIRRNKLALSGMTHLAIGHIQMAQPFLGRKNSYSSNVALIPDLWCPVSVMHLEGVVRLIIIKFPPDSKLC